MPVESTAPLPMEEVEFAEPDMELSDEDNVERPRPSRDVKRPQHPAHAVRTGGVGPLSGRGHRAYSGAGLLGPAGHQASSASTPQTHRPAASSHPRGGYLYRA